MSMEFSDWAKWIHSFLPAKYLVITESSTFLKRLAAFALTHFFESDRFTISGFILPRPPGWVCSAFLIFFYQLSSSSASPALRGDPGAGPPGRA